MRRSGFTMIELIFVIVILGILAAVAIPKLMATRTDAKIAAIAQEAQSAINEIPAYVTAKGKIDSNITNMSQVLKTLEAQGKATDNNTTPPPSGSGMTGIMTEGIIKAPKDDGTLEDCIYIDINDTTMQVIGNSGSSGAICAGVKARVNDANYSIAGSSVVF